MSCMMNLDFVVWRMYHNLIQCLPRLHSLLAQLPLSLMNKLSLNWAAQKSLEFACRWCQQGGWVGCKVVDSVGCSVS